MAQRITLTPNQWTDLGSANVVVGNNTYPKTMQVSGYGVFLVYGAYLPNYLPSGSGAIELPSGAFFTGDGISTSHFYVYATRESCSINDPNQWTPPVQAQESLPLMARFVKFLGF